MNRLPPPSRPPTAFSSTSKESDPAPSPDTWRGQALARDQHLEARSSTHKLPPAEAARIASDALGHMKEAAAAATAAAPAMRPAEPGNPDLVAMVTGALAGSATDSPAAISPSTMVSAAISALAHQG